MLIDSHCHLDFPEFTSDLDGVIERARRVGVDRLITISTRVVRFDAIASIADRHPDVFCTVGTHPHQAADESDITVEEILRLATHPKCVAIGEAGLDYHYDKAPRDVAKKVFLTHIEAARRSGLPLVIHSRDADVDMASILRDEMARGRFNAVLHCFTSSTMLAETGLDLGLTISFSGVVTFKNSNVLRAIAETVPLDRLLVETDAPFLPPVPHRGQRNEPAFVVETARILAALKGMDLGAFGQATSENALRLFNKMSAWVAAAA